MCTLNDYKSRQCSAVLFRGTLKPYMGSTNIGQVEFNIKTKNTQTAAFSRFTYNLNQHRNYFLYH